MNLVLILAAAGLGGLLLARSGPKPVVLSAVGDYQSDYVLSAVGDYQSDYVKLGDGSTRVTARWKGEPFLISTISLGGSTATERRPVSGMTEADLKPVIQRFQQDLQVWATSAGVKLTPLKVSGCFDGIGGRRSVADPTAATELELFVENTDGLSTGSSQGLGKAVRANLLKKMLRGTYRSDLAWKAWMYPATAGAKLYQKEFGGPAFNRATRELVARSMAESFEQEAKHYR